MFPTKMTKSERYINNIQLGKVNHGKWISLLIEWHINELSTSNKFEFKQDVADKYVKFIECLEFTQGKWAGKKFELQDWQAFFVSMIFGWVNKQSGLRRFKQVTLNVPKKNGKTELGAAIALACSYLDNDERGQIFMAATTQDQAAICFEAAKSIVKRIAGLSSRYIQRQHRLIVKKNETYIRYISSEADATEGKGASVVIFDEEHLQVTNELRDNLKSGMGAREQPLFISISTAGTDKNGPYYQHLKNCKKILDGIIEDDSHLILIYSAPENNNAKIEWDNPEVWKIANPNWGVSVLEENFLVDFIEAKNEPNKQPNFITKKLNIWADSSKTWIDAKKWSSLGRNLSLQDYKGQEAYIGIDLGSTGDFSAMAVLIPQSDNTIHLLMRFYISEDMAGKRTRADQLNFKEWARQGYIKLTPGDATDYNYIKEDVLEICSILNYKPIAYDKALATLFVNNLYNDYSIQVESFSQAIGSVTGPTRQLNEWIFEGKLIHDNNPVMAWMISNVEILQDDANGNYKIHKGKSKNKVDGPCAAVNAIGRYMELMTSENVITNYMKI